MSDKSWDHETIQLFDKLESQIRQQQAEIEHLKELFGCDPAYFEPDKKAKTLTDKDLFNVYADFQENYTGNNFPVDLGRAILRKAQEK